MQSRNEQTASQVALSQPSTDNRPVPSTQSTQPPSPLVQALQRKGFPTWGFVIVRSYYESDERWNAFQERLNVLCDAQIDQETGGDLQTLKSTLEFKMVEDPRLEGVSNDEARK